VDKKNWFNMALGMMFGVKDTGNSNNRQDEEKTPDKVGVLGSARERFEREHKPTHQPTM